MEDTLEAKRQLRKCFNMDFSGLACLRTLINTFRTVIDVREWVIFIEEMKCP